MSFVKDTKVEIAFYFDCVNVEETGNVWGISMSETVLHERLQMLAGVSDLPRGHQVTYYRGDIARDRSKGGRELSRQEVVSLSKFALKLWEEGHCTLIQRRHGPHDYEYIAVPCAPKHKPLLAVAALRFGR